MIYENVEEYARVCRCSLEMAQKRCEYYLSLYEKVKKIVCPSCGVDYTNLMLDDDGSEYPSENFIICMECTTSFDLNDERLKDWVAWEQEFDEVLFIAVNNENLESYEPWDQFVEESTFNLFYDEKGG